MSYVSYHAQWARRILRHRLALEIPLALRKSNRDLFGGGIPAPGVDTPLDPDNLPEASIPLESLDGPTRDLKVCIVGAGVAGLYIAMILDDLAIPGLSYEILESSSRVGGRLYTYHFKEGPQSPHDYYDIGAMRYPMIKIMDRTFDLFRRLRIQTGDYHISGTNIPNMYNDIVQIGTPDGYDPFKISRENGGPVPDSIVKKGPSAILNEVFGPYIEKLTEDFSSGFTYLMSQDNLSTREYIRNIPEYKDFYTVEYLETADSGTGLYDQAFSESVIDAFDFEAEKWKYIEGGSSVLSTAMLDNINTKPTMNARVTAIALQTEFPSHPIHPRPERKTNMLVTVNGEKEPRRYDTVFNTTSLACAQRMDLTGAELHPVVKEALRCLHYDSSTKVAIKFKTQWWRLPNISAPIDEGGSASTDMPLRVCVYPSYNLSDSVMLPAVLLCSYTWSQDAQRIGSLVKDTSPIGEDELKEMLIYELARLHSKTVGSFERAYQLINDAYLEHHAYDWYHDPNVSGAFALFGPGQFSHYYPHVTRPAADGKLHFVGEATSTHHAWVVGALDSAIRAVLHFLIRFKKGRYIRKLVENWGDVGEVEMGVKGTAHLQAILGTLKPEEQVVVSNEYS